MTGAYALVFFLIFFLVTPLFAQSGVERFNALPSIKRLDVRDVLFKQYLDDVEAGRRAVFSRYPVKTAGELAEQLAIYAYTPAPDDDLLLIAARCNIPYDTFVTLNRWPSMPALSSSAAIVLPSMPGLFLPEEPASDLERLVLSSRAETAATTVTVKMPSGKQEKFRFIPGDSLTPNERFFFLHPGLFRFPLNAYRLTSAFGMRISPISGRARMHDGLDLAAPAGTPVFAAREGEVAQLGSDPVYGKFVIIKHNESWTSLYGHLSAIDVTLHSRVKAGTMIGKVGSTGLSTGPHLHFELRENGKAHDPRRLLKQRNNQGE